MKKNIVETLMGALVLIVAATFLFISYKSGNIAPSTDGYTVVAKFREVGTLAIGSDVRLGGIKVGTVSKQYLDNNTFMAVIEFVIDDSIKIPRDSSAAIVSDGFLGGKYVSIEPGGEESTLRNGDFIKYTQDAVNIESLIGRFAFGGLDGEEPPAIDDNSLGL